MTYGVCSRTDITLTSPKKHPILFQKWIVKEIINKTPFNLTWCQ